MSRIGKQPIRIPDGVTVTLDKHEVTVKGPKGQLKRRVHPDMDVKLEDGQIVVSRPSDLRHHKALHGLTRALLNNMVQGVSAGFQIDLEVLGTGYRAEMVGSDLKLSLGYSHDIIVVPPSPVTFEVGERGQSITIRSYNKQLLGQIASDIRKMRPPEPYKGKGIRYKGEIVRPKAGKAGKVK
jgi:large subunit ribosomal protein L6